jgi:hypothetical protein
LGLESTRTLERRLKNVSLSDVISAEIHTIQGLRTASLYPASVVFKLALEFNPSLAETMGACGANVYMLGLAGYEVSVGGQKTGLELAQEQVRLYMALEAKENQLKLEQAKVELLEEDNERQAEVIDELFDYSSIIRIAKYNGCSETAFNWRTLVASSKVLGQEVKKVPCPRFGTKNLYPHDAWRLAYPSYKLPENA